MILHVGLEAQEGPLTMVLPTFHWGVFSTPPDPKKNCICLTIWILSHYLLNPGESVVISQKINRIRSKSIIGVFQITDWIQDLGCFEYTSSYRNVTLDIVTFGVGKGCCGFLVLLVYEERNTFLHAEGEIEWVSLSRWHLCAHVTLSCRNLAKSVCCHFYYLLGYHVPIDVCTCTSCLLTVKWYHCFLITNSFHYSLLSGVWWKAYWCYAWAFLAGDLCELKQS